VSAPAPLRFSFVQNEQEEKEIVRIQHSLMKSFPEIIVHDTHWMAAATRRLAVELWRDGCRAGPC
jgi:hypothetical protein